GTALFPACSSPVRLSVVVSWTGSWGACPLPCFPPTALSARRLPSLLRVPASPVPRSPRYYEGATTSHRVSMVAYGFASNSHGFPPASCSPQRSRKGGGF